MRIFYILARLYPYWAFAVSVVLMELGIYFWRQKKKQQYFFWILICFLMAGVVLWGIYRGDLHSDEWVRHFFET